MLYLVGLGGAGAKMVDCLYQRNVVRRIIDRLQAREQWPFAGIAVDTSEKVRRLSNIPAGNIVLIGKSRVKGHGTGVDVALGRRVVSEELSLAMSSLAKVVSSKPWAVLLFAGLGGGTGTGGLPVLAKRVKKTYRCKTLGVFVLPSSGEGRVYTKNAFENLDKVLSSVDGSILLDNNVLTERGEDIISAHKRINQDLQRFFRMIDEAFFERCFGSISTIAYHKPASERMSVKDVLEGMLRDRVYLKFKVESSEKMVLLARGNLGSLYGHDFAQGWVKSRFGLEMEYEFYDEPGSRGVELGLLIRGAKDLNGRFDEVGRVKSKRKSSELEDLLKDIHSIF